ncbi:hypothetical protein EDC01DRAFT_777583 [Geopyxis carbonaria]|nr:hypothetical protein EDC01DRAFT_777583 [Geopyxis carbonaria]
MTPHPPAYSLLDPTHRDSGDGGGDTTRIIYGGCLCTLLRYRILLPAGAPAPVVSSCACTPSAKSHSTPLAHHVAVRASALEWGDVDGAGPPGVYRLQCSHQLGAAGIDLANAENRRGISE